MSKIRLVFDPLFVKWTLAPIFVVVIVIFHGIFTFEPAKPFFKLLMNLRSQYIFGMLTRLQMFTILAYKAFSSSQQPANIIQLPQALHKRISC